MWYGTIICYRNKMLNAIVSAEEKLGYYGNFEVLQCDLIDKYSTDSNANLKTTLGGYYETKFNFDR